MKLVKLVAFIGSMALVVLQQTRGTAADFGARRAISLEGRLNCPYVSSTGGTVYLHVSIATPNVGRTHRKPLNLSVVLDRSGSMASEGKLDYAKRALITLIDQLSGEDILSIVIYDDRIDLLREAGPVRDKAALKRLVESVSARGSTNLGGGMMEGFRQVEHRASHRYVNRVILLSDGLANQGITDPHELSRLAQRSRSYPIVLTTMGVGLDYNENLMVRLAESGGGNYYFIESPSSLASIFRKEFTMMSSVVAQNAVLELSLGHGVRVNDVIGCEYRLDRESLVVPVGDLYSNDRRELTVELWIPPGSGTKTAVSGTLRYETSYPGLRGEPSFSAKIQYTDDVVVIERNRDLEVQAKADVAVSTRRVERAMQAVDEGRMEEAAAELDQARQILLASPATSAAGAAATEVHEQVGRLDSFQQQLRDSSDTRRAKKSIQYENYKTQKNK